jgi:hypothetical protein
MKDECTEIANLSIIIPYHGKHFGKYVISRITYQQFLGRSYANSME